MLGSLAESSKECKERNQTHGSLNIICRYYKHPPLRGARIEFGSLQVFVPHTKGHAKNENKTRSLKVEA